MATYGGDWGTRQSDEQGYAYNAFKKFFGRDPSEVELAQATSAYASGNPNKPNVQGGDAFVAQMFQNQENTPEKQYAQQQEGYKKKAPEQYGAIDQLFQQSVGRAATQEEKDHFGSILASGQMDQYSLGQWLNQLPEAVRQQDTKFREGLTNELQSQDARYFGEQVLPTVQSAFAKQGRSLDSTGFQNALAQQGTQQNRQREAFLSNLSASQYGGSQAGAREDYLNSLGRYQGLQDYGRQRKDYLTDQSTNRLYDIQNFNMQKQMYDDYLRKYGKRSSGVGSFVGGALGAGAGAYFGGPAGGQLGYTVGSGAGNIFG